MLLMRPSNMKKQIVLALTLVAALFSGCNDENSVMPMPPEQPTPDPAIRSVYPNAGAPGSTVIIFGENFGPTLSENNVTFSSSTAEATYVNRDILIVRVPNLADGDYEMSVYACGQVTRAPQMFTVTNIP